MSVHLIEPASRPRPSPRLPTTPKRRIRLRLWLPLTLLFLLLAPLVLLLAPIAWIATPPRLRISPYAAAFMLGGFLLSLGGTIIEVDSPAARVSLRIF